MTLYLRLFSVVVFPAVPGFTWPGCGACLPPVRGCKNDYRPHRPPCTKAIFCCGIYIHLIRSGVVGRCCRQGAAPESKGAHVPGFRADEEDRKLRGPPPLAQVDELGAQHGAVLQHHVSAGGPQ